MHLKAFLSAAVAVSVLAIAAPASAAVVGLTPNVDLSTGAYTATFGDASYTFSYTPNGYNTISLAVGGTGEVYGNTFLEQGQPSALQVGVTVPDQLSLGEFFAPTSPASINFSIATTYVALQFMNAGQTFYGYAQVGGSFLNSIAFNDVPNGSIITGQEITGAPGAVPEAASWAMMIAGFGLVGGALRRRTSVVATAA